MNTTIVIEMFIFIRLLTEINALENYLKHHLEMIFYPPTSEELIGTWITPMKRHIIQIKSDCETQISIGCRVRSIKKIV